MCCVFTKIWPLKNNESCRALLKSVLLRIPTQPKSAQIRLSHMEKPAFFFGGKNLNVETSVKFWG